MATWISHLRMAEELLLRFPNLEPAAFVFGSLAPDSGKPNENWTRFDPPKETTHFLSNDDGEVMVCDLAFYRLYPQDLDLAHLQPGLSFELGYYVHLLCDGYWSARFEPQTRVIETALLKDHSADETWELIKSDWYGLDHLYLRDHPESLFWKIYLPTPTPKLPLSFLPQEAFEYQTSYIKSYYTTPNPDRVLERTFPYLNQAALDRYIRDACAAALKALEEIRKSSIPDGVESALAFLSEEELEPYPAPLGDV